jgi:hypothetical protein
MKKIFASTILGQKVAVKSSHKLERTAPKYVRFAVLTELELEGLLREQEPHLFTLFTSGSSGPDFLYGSSTPELRAPSNFLYRVPAILSVLSLTRIGGSPSTDSDLVGDLSTWRPIERSSVLKDSFSLETF